MTDPDTRCRPVMTDSAPAVRPNRTYPAGETCAETECNAILSIYNSTVWCAAHESPANRSPKLRVVGLGKRPEVKRAPFVLPTARYRPSATTGPC